MISWNRLERSCSTRQWYWVKAAKGHSSTEGNTTVGMLQSSDCFPIALRWLTVKWCSSANLTLILTSFVTSVPNRIDSSSKFQPNPKKKILSVRFFFCFTRYITLELCTATLQDFVEGKYSGPAIEGTSILRHATAGISHLHSLDIVHRDIKVTSMNKSIDF